MAILPVDVVAALSSPAAPKQNPSTGATAALTPASYVGNEQVVTVTWSGFTATAPDPKSPFGYNKGEVGIYECTANPPGHVYYYSRDCYTQLPLNAIAPSDGNMLDPTLAPSQVNSYAVTVAGGTGRHGFEVLEGTLHTDSPSSLRGQQPFSIQCDATHPCVLKVVDMATFFDNQTIPNAPSTFAPGDWSDLVDRSPSIPIPFQKLSVCPVAAPTTPQVRVEGAPSSSYAVEAWAAGLCTSASPVTVDYAQLGESTAKADLVAGTTDVALSSLSPPSGPNGAGYVAAPVDVSGVAIAFNMVDATTKAPITTLRLTPRLVAMLVTNSATVGGAYFDAASTHTNTSGSSFSYALTADPEFVALNPGFHPPADSFGNLGVLEPILEGYQGDDTTILTRWIADDTDARAFLAGHDVCGAPLNANWAGISYPTSIFQDLEPTPPENGYYNPITNLATEIADLFFGKPAGFNPVDATGTASPMPPVDPSQDALLAEFDATSGVRSSEPEASLPAASATSTIGKYVTIKGTRCAPRTLTQFPGFVDPSPGGLAQGVAAMSVNPDGTLEPPVNSSNPSAYPLTKVDYAFAPTSGLSSSTASAIAGFLRFVSGPGQAPGVLPYGYDSMPVYLQAEDGAAAAAVLKGVVVPPAGSPSTSAGHTSVTKVAASNRPTAVGISVATPLSAPGKSAATASQSALSSAGGSAGSSPQAPVGATQASAQTPQAVQPPFRIASVQRTGTWLLPTFSVLGMILALAGAALRWGLPPLPRRRGR